MSEIPISTAQSSLCNFLPPSETWRVAGNGAPSGRITADPVRTKRRVPGLFQARLVMLALGLMMVWAGGTQSASAQSAAGIVRGRVTDKAGAVLAGATVTLSNLATGLDRIALTDASGTYLFAGTRGGRYRLTVSVSGFAPAIREIESASSESTDFALEPGSLTEGLTVVSGSRQEELRESLNTKVDVIGRARIRDTGYENVADVLQELPGVVTRAGTLGVQGVGASGEQIQGIDSRQVLVLFDGQPVTGARGVKTTLNLDRQSINTLERIEVVKGASSALYGSDAIGGVINQISREPNSPVETAFTTSGGSLGRLDTRGDVGFARNKFSGLFSGERHKQNPWDLTPDTPDTTGAGFHRYDAYAKVKYKFNPDFALTAWARGYWNEQRGRSIGDTPQGFVLQESFADEDSQSFNLAGNWQLNDRTAVEARGFLSRWDELINSQILSNRSLVDTGNLFERLGKVDGSISRIQGEHQLIQAGAEWMTNKYGGINRLQNDKGNSIDFASVWAQDRISLANRATVTAGLRFDNHSIFGSAVSPKAGLNLRLTDYWRIRASYGRGFRAPDLGQLFYRFLNPTNFYQVIGNPNLRPEYANTFQAGAEFTTHSRRARFSVNLFRNDIDDLIEAQNLGFVVTPGQLNAIAQREGIDLAAFRPGLGRLLFLYKNISDARTQGVEFDGDLTLTRGVLVGGAYTYLNTRDLIARTPLTQRFRHQGHLRMAWESNERIGLRANFRGTFFSKSLLTLPDDPVPLGPDNFMPSFTLWDLYGAKRLHRNLEVFGAIDNLTNSRDPNYGVPGASIFRAETGRAFRIGMRWNWERERR
ncbi:MAG TPA: TonB-dependent receptor [Blastocatellia bacterium]|nr:TonB-dependent receptor [Blastocatellia bacterium]